MTEKPSWIVLAHLLRPQGRKGEILAELLTDFPERFQNQHRVFLAPPNFNGDQSEARTAEVLAYWLPKGKNEGRIVLQFKDIETITAAEQLADLEVLIPQEERLPLDDDSTYISELIGCTVYDRNTEIGEVIDVQFPTTPDGSRRLDEAAPLLAVVSPEGGEILIPFVKAFLIAVSAEAKRIDMVLPQGLVEVNRSSNSSTIDKQ